MSDQKRPYTKKRRAEAEARTRQRITESAVELHGALGPARTSVSAIAEHAGVRRSTVYRHFPDEEALFGACSAHWASENPAPDVTAWGKIDDPEERLATALPEMYAYYRGTAEMFDKLLRDAPLMPIVARLMESYFELLDLAADALLRGRGARGRARQRTRAAIAHALAFRTWQQLTAQGLDDAGAADLMHRLIAAAAGERAAR